MAAARRADRQLPEPGRLPGARRLRRRAAAAGPGRPGRSRGGRRPGRQHRHPARVARLGSRPARRRAGGGRGGRGAVPARRGRRDPHPHGRRQALAGGASRHPHRRGGFRRAGSVADLRGAGREGPARLRRLLRGAALRRAAGGADRAALRLHRPGVLPRDGRGARRAAGSRHALRIPLHAELRGDRRVRHGGHAGHDLLPRVRAALHRGAAVPSRSTRSTTSRRCGCAGGRGEAARSAGQARRTFQG